MCLIRAESMPTIAMSDQDQPSTPVASSNDSTQLPYVIAVGASAGGLDALERFFQSLPVQTGAAFVVIQHLSPDHKSMMGNLLGRYTAMPVTTVEDGMTIAPDRIYLIPPASMMSVAGTELHLRPKSPRGLALPIDLFFSSLARAYGNRAIAVVLSGTGSDGTRGAVAINDAGGLLLSQDPESAKFDGMPRSVIATGLVDAILPPEELGPRILDHISHAPPERSPRRSSSGISYDHELRSKRPCICYTIRAGSISATTSQRRSCAASSGVCRYAMYLTLRITCGCWMATPASFTRCAASC